MLIKQVNPVNPHVLQEPIKKILGKMVATMQSQVITSIKLVKLTKPDVNLEPIKPQLLRVLVLMLMQDTTLIELVKLTNLNAIMECIKQTLDKMTAMRQKLDTTLTRWVNPPKHNVQLDTRQLQYAAPQVTNAFLTMMEIQLSMFQTATLMEMEFWT